MQHIKQQEEINKRFDEKFGKELVELLCNENTTIASKITYNLLKSFIQSEISLAVEQEKERISEKIKIYFKGLIVIPNPQATKENLLDLINNK